MLKLEHGIVRSNFLWWRERHWCHGDLFSGVYYFGSVSLQGRGETSAILESAGPCAQALKEMKYIETVHIPTSSAPPSSCFHPRAFEPSLFFVSLTPPNHLISLKKEKKPNQWWCTEPFVKPSSLKKRKAYYYFLKSVTAKSCCFLTH